MRALFSMALVAVAASVGACSGETPVPAPVQTSAAPVITEAPAGSNAEDTTFGTDLMQLQQQAIQLARLAPTRSSNSDLVALANTVATGQQSESDTVKVLLVQWNDGASPPAAPGAAAPAGALDPATVGRLESLHGQEFDTLWLQSMLGLHRAVIDLAQTEIAGGHNVDAQTLAKSILATRQAQVQQMQQMVG
ncbi:DUF305 domain-containing protein [Mycolicibacterium fluoranthenivorans]|uniref:DUF305 domain-containing protein n=1 Tax=Mycolicibacterium fluoranthenivorans TaxID=258505 RepID=A0A7G8PH90_9MYCO|nr:DUF305 domain-containing protein [Mycolicibacterium fluoranthenivorans]QNJ93706.1 DUF305 domain-containing protein [Mycolicibacterium fluoranthenivorans]